MVGRQRDRFRPSNGSLYLAINEIVLNRLHLGMWQNSATRGPQVSSSMFPFSRASHFGVPRFLTHTHVKKDSFVPFSRCEGCF